MISARKLRCFIGNHNFKTDTDDYGQYRVCSFCSRFERWFFSGLFDSGWDISDIPIDTFSRDLHKDRLREYRETARIERARRRSEP